ncbi:MAG TPA: hypothetical protein VE081_00685 [Sporichthyaceae bacterium]|nr:hypothetical protein [Sporichthyaceae bacterium]
MSSLLRPAVAVTSVLVVALTTAGVLTLAPTAGADGVCTDAGGVTTCVFHTAAGAQPFLVPSGVLSLTVRVVGGGGGASSDMTAGGAGGITSGTITVTAATSLDVHVGGGGGNVEPPTSPPSSSSVQRLRADCSPATGGSPGIGGGGTGGSGSGCAGGGGGGGGGSFIMKQGAAPGTVGDTLAAAGGGGGGGGQLVEEDVDLARGISPAAVGRRAASDPTVGERATVNGSGGGQGGAVSGGTNHPGSNGGGDEGGGSGDIGGAAGSGDATAGRVGVGGNGADGNFGGGGGGGYFGGGGGGGYSGGGGGCGFLQGVPTSCTPAPAPESTARRFTATAIGADGEVDLSYPTPPPPPPPNTPDNGPADQFPGFPPGGRNQNTTPSNVTCRSGAECTAFAGPGGDAAYDVTAHGGSGQARLFARLNSGWRPNCPGYQEYLHDFVRFGFRNPHDGHTWSKTVRVTGLHRMSHEDAADRLGKIQICFAAPYKFVPRHGYFLAQRAGWWIGILPECGAYLDRYASLNHLPAPCVSQRRLLRWDDTWVVRIVFRVPEGRLDPKALG